MKIGLFKRHEAAEASVAGKQYNYVYAKEEGKYNEDVVMQPGELLWKRYARIGVLHLPAHLCVVSQNESPFASYEQRSFVYAHPTVCFKVSVSEIDNQSDRMTLKDGVLYSADMSRLIFCWEEKEAFAVPKSVKSISPFAFCLQTKLKSIALHNGIEFIGRAAFMGCEALDNVVVPPLVTEIKDDVFDGCKSLRHIVLHDGIERIGMHAFRHCEALQTVSLPPRLKSMDSFECCYSLREIDIPPTVEVIEGFMFCRSLRKVTLHEGNRRICEYAFRYCDNLKEINFPEGLEYIGTRTFYPARIKEAVFPCSLQEIGAEAFYHNEKLRTVTFKSNVSVGRCAFACCNISNMEKPDGMTLCKEVFEQDTTYDKFCFWD